MAANLRLLGITFLKDVVDLRHEKTTIESIPMDTLDLLKALGKNKQQTLALVSIKSLVF